jgi:hypothetical protein
MRTNKIARFIDRDSVIGEGIAELDMTTRFLTADPMAKKYYQLSPYAYCANNPIRFIDPDGKYIADANGVKIYNKNTGWVDNAPQGALTIGFALQATRTGNDNFNKLVDAPYPVTLNLSSKTVTRVEDGITKYTAGNSYIKKEINKDGSIEVKKADIFVNEGTIKKYIDDLKTGTLDNKAISYLQNTNSINEQIGAVAGHESEHVTNTQNIQQDYDNKNKGTKYDVESAPNNIEMRILDETGSSKTPLLKTLIPFVESEKK